MRGQPVEVVSLCWCAYRVTSSSSRDPSKVFARICDVSVGRVSSCGDLGLLRRRAALIANGTASESPLVMVRDPLDRGEFACNVQSV